jgi:ABC-2 type transport system permease protein
MFVARIIYRIPFEGSYLTFYSIAILYFLCTLGLGILISTISKTQQQALFVTWFFLVFFLLMSGFFLPLDTMPEWIYPLTYLNPLRYFMTIVRDLFLKGYGYGELWRETIAIAVLGAATLSAALARFSKRLG